MSSAFSILWHLQFSHLNWTFPKHINGWLKKQNFSQWSKLKTFHYVLSQWLFLESLAYVCLFKVIMMTKALDNCIWNKSNTPLQINFFFLHILFSQTNHSFFPKGQSNFNFFISISTHQHSLECRAPASRRLLLAMGCWHQRSHQINPTDSRPSQWNNPCSTAVVFPSFPSSGLSSLLSTEPVWLATRLGSSPAGTLSTTTKSWYVQVMQTDPLRMDIWDSVNLVVG